MVSDASLGTATSKMNNSLIHMAHASSNRACAQDGYLKCPHPTIIDSDRDIRWDSVVDFWVLGLGDSDTWLAREKLGKNTHPNHGSHHRPMAAMVPFPQHRHIQQLANMLHDKSVMNSLTAIGPYMAHRFSRASWKVNNFLNFYPLTTFDSSKCSWALQLK
jgi:hypothetical protein